MAHRVREKRKREQEAVDSGDLSQDTINFLLTRPLDEYFGGATPEMKESVIEALVAYGTAVAHGEHRLRLHAQRWHERRGAARPGRRASVRGQALRAQPHRRHAGRLGATTGKQDQST